MQIAFLHHHKNLSVKQLNFCVKWLSNCSLFSFGFILEFVQNEEWRWLPLSNTGSPVTETVCRKHFLVTCASSEAQHKFRFTPCFLLVPAAKRGTSLGLPRVFFVSRSSATWCNTWYTGQRLYSAIWYKWEAKSCVYSQNSIKSEAFTFYPRAGTSIRS